LKANRFEGSYYSQVPRATHFSIEVIDLDSLASPSGSVPHAAILGPAIRTAILQDETVAPHLGWYEDDQATLQQFRLSPTGQGVDPYEYGLKRVNNQDVWAVMIVNANATSGVWSALTSGSMWDRTLTSSVALRKPNLIMRSNRSYHLYLRRVP